jgi:hypothetical protein
VTGDSVSEAIICVKARHMYNDITKDTPGFSPKKNQVVIILMNQKLSATGFQMKEK